MTGKGMGHWLTDFSDKFQSQIKSVQNFGD